MSRFIKNLARSGIKVHNRYSARGRRGIHGQGAVLDVEINFPLDSFIRRLEQRERQVLYASGRYALRVYRSQLRRTPPTRLTAKGRKSARYRREVEQQAVRPPYKRTGILYRSTEFVVDEASGRFDAGPPLITGLSRFVKSKQPVPGLLDQGGPALVRVGRRRRGTPERWEPRVYRAFPYQPKVFTKTLEFFRTKIEGML